MPYTKEQILKISNCTSNFYQCVNKSFSETRNNPWPGWDLFLDVVLQIAIKSKEPIRILDIGCGNLRYEKYLTQHLNNNELIFDCIDNCKPLVEENIRSFNNLNFYEDDIIKSLLNDKNFIKSSNYDLVVSFGLFHHIPNKKIRYKLIKQMLKACNKNGIVAISFWQFMTDKRLAKKAFEATVKAKKYLNIDTLEDNDYFLQWKDNGSVYRYCHYFNDEEIDNIINDLQLNVIKGYNEDGATGNLNKYLVIQNS